MDYKARARTVATAVCQALGVDPSRKTYDKVADVIECALMDAVVEDLEHCADVAVKCGSADRDLAYKIASEIRRKQTALIANLSSMR